MATPDGPLTGRAAGFPDASAHGTNIFAAMLDALNAALSRLNYGDLAIVVGECGEDEKSTAPGPFETHWGLCTMGAQAKYGLVEAR